MIVLVGVTYALYVALVFVVAAFFLWQASDIESHVLRRIVGFAIIAGGLFALIQVAKGFLEL